MILLLKSLLIGIAIAAPVGPIGVLCINRTLKYGLLAGLITGTGVATADAIYGCISGFGLTFISSFYYSINILLPLQVVYYFVIWD